MGLLVCITDWLYRYDDICARIPSAHGFYEVSVPEQLCSSRENGAYLDYLDI